MSELTETALVLTHEHHRPKPEGGYAKEPALLDTLREAVASSGTGTGAGGTRTGSPIDLGALDLLNSIERVVNTCWPGNGDPAYVRTPLRLKLNTWVNHTTNEVAEAELLTLCRQWVAQIREKLEPTRRIPLANVACPVCKFEKHPVEMDGEWINKPTLVAYPEADPIRVECEYPQCPTTDDNPNVWEGTKVVESFFT